MCLTFRKKFARNNTACPCVLAQFFEKVKHYLLNYGRVFYSCFKRIPSRFLRFRLVPRFYAFLLCWLASFPLLGEWTSADTSTLNGISNDLALIQREYQTNIGLCNFRDLGSDVDTISSVVVQIRNILGIVGESSLQDYADWQLRQFGYGVGSSQTGNIAQDFDTVISKLSDILTALEGGTGSGGSVGSEIEQDWLTESTFQTYYDWMRSSLGFEGGSSGSLKDLISPWYNIQGVNGYSPTIDLWYYSKSSRPTLGLNSPFPVTNSNGTDGVWYDTSEPKVYYLNETYSDPFAFLGAVLAEDSILERQFNQGLAKKQAWNDWYAHTNLVATITQQADRFFTQPTSDPSPTPSFNPSTGQMSTPSSGTGSADETITVSPSFTNDFAQIEQDTNSVTNNFAFVKEQEIRNRYFVDGILDVGEYRDYATVGSGFSDVFNIAGMTIDLGSQFVNYRKIISSETLQTVRTVVGYLWHFLAVVASFFVVVKISGMSFSGGDE